MSTSGSVCVIVPTRGRPEKFVDLIESFYQTSSHAKVIAYVDDDEKEVYGSLDLPDQRLEIHVGPRLGPVRSVNAIASKHREFFCYGVSPDDSIFVTDGWDDYAMSTIRSFPNHLGILSPAHDHGYFVNFPYASRQWIDLLGWFAYPEEYHFCWDTVLEILGEATTIHYAPPDRFCMRHTAMTTINYNDHFQKDAESFLRWCVTGRRELVQRILRAQQDAKDYLAKELIQHIRGFR